ncbi:hypothetical protein ABIE89_000276 [Bradyrhizobium niftali]|uniref:hypothetical protein n=1 Tax=Bradyrhizobium niftali TaxID=2560055 RepID=UPI0038386A8E
MAERSRRVAAMMPHCWSSRPSQGLIVAVENLPSQTLEKKVNPNRRVRVTINTTVVLIPLQLVLESVQSSFYGRLLQRKPARVAKLTREFG